MNVQNTNVFKKFFSFDFTFNKIYFIKSAFTHATVLSINL